VCVAGEGGARADARGARGRGRGACADAALAASKVGPSQADALEKQKEVVREKLVAANRGLSRAKGMVSVLLPMIAYAIYPLMTWAFSGLTVATLPFEPFDLVKRWSHQGLEGAGPLDCSYSFIYLLAGMGVRQVFARLIAPRPPKGAGVAGMGANPLADIFQDATERAQQIQKKGSFL
jgi:hypothetical protein